MLSVPSGGDALTIASIDELTERVRALLADSDFKDLIGDVRIEPAFSEDDWEVLRVFLQVSDPKKIEVAKASQLIRRIVDSLLEVDDRFPSVRFAEAA
jgi:hypothetical protein